MKMTLDEINWYLQANVLLHPFGSMEWRFQADEDEDDPEQLVLTLENPFARDSRSYDFYDEADEWTLMDGRTQGFTAPIPWPVTTGDLKKHIVHLTAYAMAHEALEWLRIDDKMPHDPHTDGDVIVKVPND